MKKLIPILMIAGAWTPIALWAQVPAPNEAGVAMGHFHVYARDLASAKQVWVSNIGGTPIKVDGTDVVKFPGVLVFLEQGSQSVAGTEGTAVNHIGFFVLNGKDFLTKWKAAGFKEDLNDPKIGDHGYIYTAEGLKIEIQENHILKDEGKAQTLPIGTGEPQYYAKPGPTDDGLLWWGPRLFDVAGGAQSQGAHFQAEYLMGNEWYTRVNFKMPSHPWRLDDVSALPQLLHFGAQAAVDNYSKLRQTLLATTKPAYHPF